jgi:Ras-related protein Rab-33B
MISHYYRNVHAILFVYDVTNPSTFENLGFWIEESNKNMHNQQIPRILVGNKCDLVNDHAVPTNIAQRFADMHQMPLFETSARDDSNHDHVESIFMTVALKLKNSKQLIIPKETNKNINKKVELASNEKQNDESSCFC